MSLREYLTRIVGGGKAVLRDYDNVAYCHCRNVVHTNWESCPLCGRRVTEETTTSADGLGS